MNHPKEYLPRKNLMKIIINPLYIQFVPYMIKFKSTLTIDRKTSQFTHKQVDMDNTFPNKTKTLDCYGFLGILSLYAKQVLFFVKDAQNTAQFDGHPIFKVTQVTAVHMVYQQNEAQDPMEWDTINSICKYIEQSQYFSYTYDLTQDIATQLTKSDPQRIEKGYRFWWNFNMLRQAFSQNVQQDWCLRIIQGYVGSFKVILKNSGKELEYILISRREWLRGGTRYNHRGIDEDGNTSNYVETEQIIRVGQKITQHIQVRGSVPIFWQQVGIRAVSELTKDVEGTRRGFFKHFDRLQTQHSDILCVNLMSKDKLNEDIISKKFECQIQQGNFKKSIIYRQIDFYALCKNYDFQNLNNEIYVHQEYLNKYQYFAYDQTLQKVQQMQSGIVRTNCLDCLDRTNVFMNKIALYMAQRVLQDMGYTMREEFNCDSLLLSSENINHMPKFVQQLKQKWGENGDAISKVYVGTNATTTKLSTQGGGGWTGLFETSMKGLERFYQQNVKDKEKHQMYELIVGSHRNSIDENQRLIQQIQDQIVVEREIKDSISTLIISWDINQHTGQDLNVNMQHLFQINLMTPDFIIIMISGVPTTQLPEYDRTLQWQNFFTNSIQQFLDGFQLLQPAQMLSQITLVYARVSIMQYVRSNGSDKIKIDDTKQSRGAIISKIFYKNLVIGIVNSSLSNNPEKKKQNIQQIWERSISPLDQKTLLQQCDYVYFSGDLNLNIQINQVILDETLRNINQQLSDTSVKRLKQLKQIYEMDEFHNLKNNQFFGFQDTQIDEIPSQFLSKSIQIQWKNRILFGTLKNYENSIKYYNSVQNFCEGKPYLSPRVMYSTVIKRGKFVSQLPPVKKVELVIVQPTIVNEEEEELDAQQIEDDLCATNISVHFYCSPKNKIIDNQNLDDSVAPELIY